MRITITGGTGFIGSHLRPVLESDGVEVSVFGRRPPPYEAVRTADALVHLAGEPVSQRWNDEVKRRIRSSRVDSTREIVGMMGAGPQRPGVFVCASAIGIYGSRGDEVLTEDSAPGTGFLPDVCREWEQAAAEAESLGIRTIMLRIGIVLGNGGGALKTMLPIFRAGVGGNLGDGDQWMSWIHIADVTGLIAFALKRVSSRGPLNATAPEPVRNAGFTHDLAHVVQRPAILSVPRFALKLMYGEMAGAVLSSQRALPARALDAGYSFRFPELRPALADVLRGS